MNILSKAGKIVTIVLAALGFAGAMPADAQTSIIWQSTWTLCSGTYCPGWAPWESDSQTEYIVVSDSGVVYNLTWSGQVRSSGPTTPAWTLMSSSSDIDQIDARGGVYQVHNSGEVDRWVTPSGSHPQWTKIDKRSNIWQIAAGAGATELYEILTNGQIWRYTGTGWQELDNNPLGLWIAAGNNVVYQMHSDGSIWQYTGTPSKAGVCGGWQMLDDNSATIGIAAGGDYLYQMHGSDEPIQ